jgi:hypothetical protein
MNEEYQTRQFFNNDNMNKLELQKIIKEEILKEGEAAIQDELYNALSKLKSSQILGALASLMSIREYNLLMKKVGLKLNQSDKIFKL